MDSLMGWNLKDWRSYGGLLRDMEIVLFCWGEVDLMFVEVRVVMTGFPWNEDLEEREVVKVEVAIVAAMLTK